MKTEVIRSGDKNFEEEKAKMFEPKTLNKEEQLELVFNHLLEALLVDFEISQYGGISRAEIKQRYAQRLLKEVKIRAKL